MTILTETFEGSIWARYQPRELIGQGVYGKVHRAICIHSQRVVAIKESASDADGILSTTLREIALLKQVKHRNLIQMIEAEQCQTHHAVFIVMEYCDVDLRTFIDEQPRSGIDLDLAQILSGLAELHTNGIIHRDIKPQNILVLHCGNGNHLIKIADFGLGRRVSHVSAAYTPDTQTMLYRAPEVYAAKRERYTIQIDVFSVGCIFAGNQSFNSEMIRGETLLRGQRELELLGYIIHVIGYPAEDELSSIELHDCISINPDLKNTKSQLPDMVVTLDEQGLDLLEKMLRFSPYKRITSLAALKHPYFDNFTDDTDQYKKSLALLGLQFFLMTSGEKTSAQVGELHCQQDSYAKSLTAKVLSCEPEGDRFAVLLSDTIIFPTGGGQPNDVGTIDAAQVVDCQRRGLKCVHITDAPLEVGKEVEIKLDWDRRYDHMQQHSGQHLISDLAEIHFNLITFGWKMGNDKSFVEFKGGAAQTDLDKLEDIVNGFIRKGHQVIVESSHIHEENRPDTLPDDIKSGVLRNIGMGDIPLKPCCGTHVAQTSDIQAVKFLNTEKVRGGNTKVWFVAGHRVLKSMQAMLAREAELNAILTTAPDQFAERVKKLKEQNKGFMKDIKKLEKELKSVKATENKS
ncbi:Alanyl-tRNA editing protein Aarsd1 [Terramyces sp. JEL0728]|nr:Alanyl-tRNA editing protein Aarsd1 [Terramyces sp. JEL0728]